MNRCLRLLAFGTAALATGAFSQYVKVNINSPEYGTDVYHGHYFNSKTVTTIKAKIKGISKTPGSRPGEATDVSLLVWKFSMAPDRYGKQRMVFADGFSKIELGPQWFVDDQSTKLHVNDYVEINGSQMSADGVPVLLARTVRHGHDILALRRLSGSPYWYALKPEHDQMLMKQQQLQQKAQQGPQLSGSGAQAGA